MIVFLLFAIYIAPLFKANINKMKVILLSILMCVLTCFGFTQNVSVKGKIVDDNNDILIGVSIFVQKKSLGAITNKDGNYELKLPKGNHILSISYLGYESIFKQINITDNLVQTINFRLKESSIQLKDFIIKGKSKVQRVQELSYAVEAVDTKVYNNLSTNANDILAKMPGVNIRQSGGLGSSFNLSLNGLSGKQVRTFIDGVPMDYFGSSLSLNNFSPNMIDRIEVYKGVVPIHLSADAIGGAINIITSKRLKSFLDVSTGFGSYGTRISSLNAQYINPKNGFIIKVKSFYNEGDNNYKVPVKLLNVEIGKEDKFYTEVERFHDAYESKMLWMETGLTGKKYADELLFGLMYSDNYKEIQQNPNAIGEAKIPFGEVVTSENKYISNFTYRKKGLFSQRLSVNAYLVAVFSENKSKDISDYRYDWFGNKSLRNDITTGEISYRKINLVFTSTNFLASTNLKYNINENNNLALNYSFNSLKIEGKDDYNSHNKTQFEDPTDMQKQVLAFAFDNSKFDNKLKTTLFTKLYKYHVNSVKTNYTGDTKEPINDNEKYLGWGLSTTYKLGKLQIKTSFEKAIRFPEIIELLGDGGILYDSSLGLKPEKSNNYNLGFIYRSQLFKNDFTVSINGFIRDAKDFIYPKVEGGRAYHINTNKVLSRGIDVSSTYKFTDNLFVNINATYIDLRDNEKLLNGEAGNPNTQYEVRLPNKPYLFGNLSLSYKRDNIFKEKDDFSLNINQNYVHSFYYQWENFANKNKSVVPEQFTTNIDLVYSLNNGMYNISFGVSNLRDSHVYDNFKQLKPGRTYNLKFRYFIN